MALTLVAKCRTTKVFTGGMKGPEEITCTRRFYADVDVPGSCRTALDEIADHCRKLDHEVDSIVDLKVLC